MKCCQVMIGSFLFTFRNENNYGKLVGNLFLVLTTADPYRKRC